MFLSRATTVGSVERDAASARRASVSLLARSAAATASVPSAGGAIAKEPRVIAVDRDLRSAALKRLVAASMIPVAVRVDHIAHVFDSHADARERCTDLRLWRRRETRVDDRRRGRIDVIRPHN